MSYWCWTERSPQKLEPKSTSVDAFVVRLKAVFFFPLLYHDFSIIWWKEAKEEKALFTEGCEVRCQLRLWFVFLKINLIGLILTELYFLLSAAFTFMLPSYVGEIRVQKDYSLDFEVNPHIQLVVLADSGLQTAHCRVSITLVDINDNAPQFEHSSYRTAVWEGQVHNTYIMQVNFR